MGEVRKGWLQLLVGPDFSSSKTAVIWSCLTWRAWKAPTCSVRGEVSIFGTPGLVVVSCLLCIAVVVYCRIIMITLIIPSKSGLLQFQSLRLIAIPEWPMYFPLVCSGHWEIQVTWAALKKPRSEDSQAAGGIKDKILLWGFGCCLVSNNGRNQARMTQEWYLLGAGIYTSAH